MTLGWTWGRKNHQRVWGSWLWGDILLTCESRWLYYCTHFTDGKTEAQRQIILPGSCSEGSFFTELDLGIVYNQNIILGYFDYDIFMCFFSWIIVLISNTMIVMDTGIRCLEQTSGSSGLACRVHSTKSLQLSVFAGVASSVENYLPQGQENLHQ